MKSFSNSERWKEPIVHRRKMAPEIDKTVFPWRNFLLKLSRRQAPKQFFRLFHVGLPPAERGVDEPLLCCHLLPAFHLDEPHVLSRAAPVGSRLLDNSRRRAYPCGLLSHAVILATVSP